MVIAILLKPASDYMMPHTYSIPFKLVKTPRETKWRFSRSRLTESTPTDKLSLLSCEIEMIKDLSDPIKQKTSAVLDLEANFSP